MIVESRNISHNVAVFNLQVVVDVEDLFQQETLASLATGLLNVQYPTRFFATPSLNISLVNSVSGDVSRVTNESPQGFTIEVIDQGGARVARQFNYIARGY